MFFGGNPVTVSPPAYAPTRESSSRARPGAPTGLRGAPTVPFRSVSRQDPPKNGGRSLRGLRLSRGAFGGTPVPIMGRRVPPNGREALAKRDIMQPPARFQDGLKAPPASTPLTEISPFVTRPIRWIRGGSSRMRAVFRQGAAGRTRGRRPIAEGETLAIGGGDGRRTGVEDGDRRAGATVEPVGGARRINGSPTPTGVRGSRTLRRPRPTPARSPAIHARSRRPGAARTPGTRRGRRGSPCSGRGRRA